MVSVQHIGVIGAGTMGNGIAQVCALSGLDVTMVDISDAVLAKGLTTINDSIGRLVKKEKLSAAQRDAALARIKTATQYAELSPCQLVIEAATENPELKRRILKQADEVLGAPAILATNTSSISITQLGAGTSRADRFIGMHFFNPVPLMSLLEVIRGLQTSDATHAAAMDFGKAIGKTPITVKNSPGFAVNRILCPMINEAIFTLQEGVATAEDIDTGMKLGCNHPIGPLALGDLIGLDTLLAIMEVFHRDLGDPKYRAPQLLREMVAAGHLGRKTGRGFYSYS
jgi:3-hydroxybutyryl-CoA dehydrogenase